MRTKRKTKATNKPSTVITSTQLVISTIVFVAFYCSYSFYFKDIPVSTQSKNVQANKRFPVVEKIDDDDNFAIKMVQEYALRTSSHSTLITPTPDASIPNKPVPNKPVSNKPVPNKPFSTPSTSTTPDASIPDSFDSEWIASLSQPVPNKLHNLLQPEDSTFESSIGNWAGYCGAPKLSTSNIAHSGQYSLLYPASNRKSAIWCAPLLKFPKHMKCGVIYRLSMYVTTNAQWHRKSPSEQRVGHHSHFLLVAKKNGVGSRCKFKSREEFSWISAQSVNLATEGRWIKLDGLIQFGYDTNVVGTDAGFGHQFHVEGIDQDADILIDDVVLTETDLKPWNKKEHEEKWNYPTKPRSFSGPPMSLLLDVPDNDEYSSN